MGIAYATPLAAGNAVQLALAPVDGAVWWRVLRRSDADFVGPVDPAATLVCDGSVTFEAVDFLCLTNGKGYFYQLYSSLDGTTLEADGAPVMCTPNATYQDAAPDPQTVLRDRIEAGLAVEVLRQNLKPAKGKVPVFTAPFAMQDQVSFPCVSIHLQSAALSERYIGDTLIPDGIGEDGQIASLEGGLWAFTINVNGTSQNPDERIELRKALRRIIQANMAVFDAAGMVECSFSQTDTEQLGTAENAVPLYYTVGSFTCRAALGITDSAPPLSDVVLNATISSFTGVDQING